MGSPVTDALPGDLLTYEEAAALLNIQRAAIQTAIGNGKLHPIKLPGSARKYLRRDDVLSYPERRNAPVAHREKPIAPPTPPASEALDAAKLRELAGALSGPTLEAFREAMSTARHGVGSLAQIAFGVALGASGMAGGAALDPKR